MTTYKTYIQLSDTEKQQAIGRLYQMYGSRLTDDGFYGEKPIIEDMTFKIEDNTVVDGYIPASRISHTSNGIELY